MNIKRTSPVYKSFRTDQVAGMFDTPYREQIVNEWTVNIPLDEKPWLIGLIVGASGSGKTTIANEVFKDAHIHTAFEWPDKASMLDGFPKELPTKEIVETLSSVGLSSPPHWLKPFGHLSNGQKFRAELARLVLSGHKRVVFDEFTSVVDRDVAKVCSATLAKTIRRRQCPQLVAVSCHFDVLDWLQPDWVYEVGTNRFEWRTLRRRPEIKLTVYETDVSTWPIFRGHHYLSADISTAARCFVATWNEKPVSFSSVLHFPHPRVRNFKREHRTVVLPDFQGVGIGNALSEAVAQHFVNKGFRFVSTTSHPAMIRHRSHSPLWRCNRGLSRVASGTRTSNPDLKKTLSVHRLTAGFEFVGKKVAPKAVGTPPPAVHSGKSPDTTRRSDKLNQNEKDFVSDTDAQVVRAGGERHKKAGVSQAHRALGKAPRK